ncbi:MAG: cytochrome c maturation protein CcmE [Gemmatimonadetes bacterium]|nr:MAG: cytochrome c maturation protein CcmE [Gemmatimonadota bacterium]
MAKHGRFYVGLVGVAAVVTYLIWTGVSQTMVYYLTPTELLAQVEQDPTLHDVGLKVSGRVVRGSWTKDETGGLEHHFRVEDLEDPSVSFPVVYRDVLPDTFNDSDEHVEVVVEGRFRPDGVFEATEVLTKCGSRYEAAPEGVGT